MRGNHDAAAAAAAVREIRAGDHRAYSRIVDLYQRRLFGLALMMMREPSAAEEVTQDAFVRAFELLDRYDESRPLYPWLAAIAVRLAQTRLRKEGRERSNTLRLTGEGEEVYSEDHLARLIDDETKRGVWQEISALSSGERTVVLMFYRDEMKVNDMARALGVTPGTVKTLLFRARRRLRLALGSPDASLRR